MSYRVLGYLGAPPPPAEPSATEQAETSSFENPLAPLTTSRGFVKVPTYDVRQYVQTTLVVLAVGFSAGVGIGAVFGNILGEKRLAGSIGKVFRNPRRRRRRRRNSRRTRKNAGRRRTSARRRRRGRPSGRPVSEKMTVTLDRRPIDVSVERGSVYVGRRRLGSVYDLGTSFRSIPSGDGEVRSYGTLAGAVKHLIRETEAA